MSIDSEMDEDNMVHIYNGILVNQKKKKERIPFVATGRGLEIVSE